MCDLQKASMWKRISALLFDFIIMGMLVVGIAFLLSGIFGYDDYSIQFSGRYEACQLQYGVDFDISQEAYAALSPQEKENFDRANEAFLNDSDAQYAYHMMLNLTLVITGLSILLAYLILEFAVPLLFGNGQTLGKKIFGIGVMRTDGVKISTLALFVRTILGKYTIETMIPVFVILLIFLGSVGLPGTLLVLALLVVQIILVAVTRTNAPIHDLLAGTVVIDMPSQMIFDSEEAMISYKEKLHARQAEQSRY